MNPPYTPQMYTAPPATIGYPYNYPPQPAYSNMNTYANQTPTMPTRPSLYGRVVNDIAEVVANEVPMDGSSSIFPLQDNSAIYVKSWGADGAIRTLRYVLQEEPLKETKVSGTLSEMIEKRFDDMELLLETVKESLNKKEVNNNGHK